MSCVPVAGLQLTPVSYAFPLQTTRFNKPITLRTFSIPYFRRRLPMISLKSTSLIRRYQPLSTMNSASLSSEYGEPDPMRLFQSKGMSGNGTDQASPWKPIEKGVGSFGNGMSIEDIVKQQILNKEYYNGNGGGNGRKPPGGGGGSGDEGMWDGEEFKQVTFATLGIIFVCIYIAERAQINALAKDSLQYVFTGKQSTRFKRVIEPFKKFLRLLRGEDQNQLEYEISSTPGDDRDDNSVDND